MTRVSYHYALVILIALNKIKKWLKGRKEQYCPKLLMTKLHNCDGQSDEQYLQGLDSHLAEIYETSPTHTCILFIF